MLRGCRKNSSSANSSTFFAVVFYVHLLHLFISYILHLLWRIRILQVNSMKSHKFLWKFSSFTILNIGKNKGEEMSNKIFFVSIANSFILIHWFEPIGLLQDKIIWIKLLVLLWDPKFQIKILFFKFIQFLAEMSFQYFFSAAFTIFGLDRFADLSDQINDTWR